MGLSFHDESSIMVEATSSIESSMRFSVPDDSDLTSENEIADEERRNDDSEIQLRGDSDIQIVDR